MRRFAGRLSYASAARLFRAAPAPAQLFAGVALVLALWLVLNLAWQVIRKPAELLYPVSGALHKTPAETWRQYQSLFREHSTALMTPELLAALAQVEAAGNPAATTSWRWQASWNPFEWYRPASSAVGMYQITDAAFAEAKRYCIRSHVVVDDGPWHDFKSCWFNGLYLRVIPGHAVEMTSAFLDRRVSAILRRQGIAATTLQRKQDLAAVIHLCGAAAGEAYAARGLRLTPGQRCGSQDVLRYLTQVNAMKRQFAALNR